MAEAGSALFADLLGQPRAVSLLEAALARDRLAPAYLFAGPEGVGRRLAALRLLEGVLAGPAGAASLRRRLAEGNHPDLLWVEPTYQHQGRLVPLSAAEAEGVTRRTPPQIRLEQVREISRSLGRRPLEGPRSLVVIDGAEAMAEAAANALLKTLEEPGDGLLILLCAAPERLLSTIRSRCQLIPFVRLPAGTMAQVLAGLVADASPATAAAAGRAPITPAEATPAELARDSDPERPDPPELLELAAGSPGALLRHRHSWRALPAGLAERLLRLEPDPLTALGLARDLCEELDGEQQLWLLGWWQLALWRRHHNPAQIRRLDRLRSHLLAFVQPRLAWEVALLDLTAAGSS